MRGSEGAREQVVRFQAGAAWLGSPVRHRTAGGAAARGHRLAPDATVSEAGSYPERIAGELAGKGVRVRSEVRRGDPAEQIVAAARAADADLIAMTTRGHGGISRLLPGSVAPVSPRAAASCLRRPGRGDDASRAA